VSAGDHKRFWRQIKLNLKNSGHNEAGRAKDIHAHAINDVSLKIYVLAV
jgi:hypothetical protein